MNTVDNFLAVVKAAPKNSVFSERYDVDYDYLRDVLVIADASERDFVMSDGISAIWATMHCHDFNPRCVVCSIKHFFSNGSTGGKLLECVHDWAEDYGAYAMTEFTLHNNDPRVVNYFKRKGFEHIGYTFIKEV